VGIPCEKRAVWDVVNGWVSTCCSEINYDEGLFLLVYDVIKVLYTHRWRLKLVLDLFDFFNLFGFLFHGRSLFYGVNSNFFKIGSKNSLKLLDASEIVMKRIGCIDSLLLFRSTDASCGLFFFIHKTYQAENNRWHGPTWIPEFWMIVTKVSADFFARLKSSIWSQHLNTWGFERVVPWKT